jgi:hypothetical protein
MNGPMTHWIFSTGKKRDKNGEMSSNELIFKLTSEKQCPLYEPGDIFMLAGNALRLKFEKESTFISTAIVRIPGHKEVCHRLIADITNVLIHYGNLKKIPLMEMDCSGCEGTARIKFENDENRAPSLLDDSASKNIEIAASLLNNFSLFRLLDEENLRQIVALLKVKKYPKDSVIIRKGDTAKNLYIILSGGVDVLTEFNERLSTLGKGDVFGEMSLISGNPVGAKIKVSETATIVSLDEKNFKKVLNQFPSIQMYLARVLAKRLADSNLMRSDEIGLITGRVESPGSKF